MTEAKLRQKVVDIAENWLGCKESNGTHKKIIDKYNAHKPLARGYAVKYTDAWCATFASAVFITAGLTDIAPTECSCHKMIELYKKLGRWKETDSYKPSIGDLMMYDWNDSGKGDNTGMPDHVGIVVSVSGSTIKVIEGNRNEAVAYRTVAVNGRYIRGYCLPDYASKATEESTYRVEDNMHIVAIPAKDFKVTMVDKAKKNIGKASYCNAGYFCADSENKEAYTLPVAHLVCDHESSGKLTNKYCTERGKFSGNKFTFDSSKWSYANEFHGKSISTLLIKNGKASIEDIKTVPSCEYAISGVPIMKKGEDVKFKTYVVGQGWTSGNVRATWHTFIGLKKNDNNVYVVGMKTTTSNMVLSAEAFNKFKEAGFHDVIKLDGGGSFHFKVDGKVVASTSENRRINTIIPFGSVDATNPYKKLSVTLQKGSKGEGVKWLQWQLNYLGYNCGEIDGSFGSKTLSAVKKFQKARGLEVDGYVGPLTRSALIA